MSAPRDVPSDVSCPVSQIEIRPETAGDEEGIRAVHVASFPTDEEARLVDRLRASGRLLRSWVAVADDAIVGHVGFSPVQLTGTPGGEGVAPVAVVPGWRRRGVAERLVHAGLGGCARDRVPFIVVLGFPGTYARFGFRPASQRGLVDEFGGGDAFQVLELQPDALPPSGGTVAYAPEFDVWKT